MYRYFIFLFLALFSPLFSMNWTIDDEVSDKTIEAFAKLGIKLSTDPREAKKILKLCFFEQLKRKYDETPLKFINGNDEECEIPEEQITNFLDYIDENTIDTELDHSAIDENSIIILPIMNDNSEIVTYLINLWVEYYKYPRITYILVASETIKEIILVLLKTYLPSYTSFEIIVASDKKLTLVSSCKQLLKQLKKNNGLESFFIVTHSPSYSKIITDILKNNRTEEEKSKNKLEHIRTRLKSIPWRDMTKFFKDKNNNPQARLKIYDALNSINQVIEHYESKKNSLL